MNSLTVVKVGGGIVENAQTLQQFLSVFASIDSPKMLIHGGGRSATAIAQQLGLETKMVNGRRVTDAEMLKVVTMVYGGLVNKNIVAHLQALGVNALGLTGADCDIIRSHRRKPVTVTADDGTSTTVDYGFVGDVDSADGTMLRTLIESGIVPVLAPLTHDGNGSLLNTNADTIASTAAIAAAKAGMRVKLVYTFEKNGVLANPDDDSSVIPLITADSFRELVSNGTIQGGMIPKIENALAACESGIESVVITNAMNINGGTEVRLTSVRFQ